MPQHHQQHQVPPRKINRRIHHLGTPRAVRQLRDPEDQPAPPLQMLQPRRRRQMIRLRALCPYLRQRIDKLPQMPRARCRQQLLLNPSPVHQQRSLVARLHHRLRQRHRRTGRLIKLRKHEPEILV